MVTENVQMQMARDTRANWTLNNPILGTGEIGFETDTGNWKVGDGSTSWGLQNYLGCPSVTAMPTSPVTGERLWRSDLNFEFFYDGTRWLSTELLTMSFNYLDDNAESASVILAILPVPFLGVFGIWLESVDVMLYKAGTNTWSTQITWSNTNARNTIFTSQAFTQNGAYQTDSNNPINTVLDPAARALYHWCDDSIAGTSNSYPCAALYYRVIGV